MQRDYRRWYSHRVGCEMGVVVYGHWGVPVLAFPTSGGTEWELEQMGLIGAIARHIDAGRVKVFAVGSNSGQSFYNTGVHPFHRSWMQRMFDEYIRWEVIPFIHDHCRGLPAISAMGASLGAYHAANTLFKHADAVKRCWALSGIYDLRQFMSGMTDDNFYFNNPMDYLGGMHDPGQIAQLNTCEIHIATGTGPWERPESTYQLSHVLALKRVRHHLDDWGAAGGHDWPYWTHQIQEYLARI